MHDRGDNSGQEMFNPEKNVMYLTISLHESRNLTSLLRRLLLTQSPDLWVESSVSLFGSFAGRGSKPVYQPGFSAGGHFDPAADQSKFFGFADRTFIFRWDWFVCLLVI